MSIIVHFIYPTKTTAESKMWPSQVQEESIELPRIYSFGFY